MRTTTSILLAAAAIALCLPLALAAPAPGPLDVRRWKKDRWESQRYKQKMPAKERTAPGTWLGEVEFTLNIWFAGFCAHLHLVNPGSVPSATWELSIALPPNSDIYTSWSGYYEATSDDGLQYIATPQDWNSEIVPGSSKKTGFCVQFPSNDDTVNMPPPKFVLKMYQDSAHMPDPCDPEPEPMPEPEPEPCDTETLTSTFPTLTPTTLIPLPGNGQGSPPPVTRPTPAPTTVSTTPSPTVSPSATPTVIPSTSATPTQTIVPTTPPSSTPVSTPTSTSTPTPTSSPPTFTPSQPPSTPLPGNDPLVAKAQAGKLLVGYWGQNIAAANAGKTGVTSPEADIDAYCSGPYDVVNIAFANVFRNAESTIDINLSNHCGETFPGSTVLNCPAVGQAIARCQALGKKVLLSLGGGISSVGFSNEADVARFTNALWNMFLGGTDTTFDRPFGNVVLDGFDLDVESGDDFGYDIFMNGILNLMRNSGRRFYTTAAPQCFFPDVLQETAYKSGYFDWLNIQWYNNACGNNAFPTPAWRDAVEFWFNWANTVSVNRDVRLLIGAPGSVAAASDVSFVPLDDPNGTANTPTLKNIIDIWKRDFGSRFGGVMLWEVTTAEANGNYAQGVRGLLGA